MDRSKLDAAAKQISDYTARHPELCEAHHFVYDYPLFDDFRTAGKPEIVVMGINPGETSTDRTDGQRREATWNGWRSHTASARNWAALCEDYTNSRLLISAELFFWSSHSGPKRSLNSSAFAPPPRSNPRFIPLGFRLGQIGLRFWRLNFLQRVSRPLSNLFV